MRQLKKWAVCLLGFLIHVPFAQGQGGEGTQAYKQNGTIRSKSGGARAKNELRTTTLPFFDDFFYNSSRPNDTLWEDDYVRVNYNFGVNPPSAGVATFDGLDERGQPYLRGYAGTASRPCDTLSSQYINLSTLQEGDSVYLSFYYQPQGLSDDNPELNDSLILEFKADSALQSNGKYDTLTWSRVWAVGGSRLHPFRLVMIPIRQFDTANFFHSQFRFRFRSLGNPSGLLDPWHLDYVYLDRGRFAGDTIFNDVAITASHMTLLKDYYGMPWRQAFFDTSKTFAKQVQIRVRNNFNIDRNVRYGFNITWPFNGQLLAKANSVVDANVLPKVPTTLPLATYFQSRTPRLDELYYKVTTSAISVVSAFNRRNDSLSAVQTFANYLAYDDGTAESAYYLEGSPIMKAAVRYTLPLSDTLFGVQIHFAENQADIGPEVFDLIVWNELPPVGSSQMDNPVYEMYSRNPKFVDTLNGFAYYEFEAPVPVSNQFYIGWRQTKDYRINIGFDKNYRQWSGFTSNPNLFINVDGIWRKSSQDGALMIRPVLDTRPKLAIAEPKVEPKKDWDWKLYPNPSAGISTIKHNGQVGQLQVYNIAGQLMMSQLVPAGAVSTTLDASALQSGMYLIVALGRNGEALGHKKWVLQHGN